MTGDADLLRELSMFDEVEAMTVGSEDMVGQGTEVILDIKTGNSTRRIEMTRHDGELIIEVLHSVLHPNTHDSSPTQRLWALLDETMDYLMADGDPEPEDRARARALAEAIAMVTQPWSEKPDVAAIRDQAVERWEQRDVE